MKWSSGAAAKRFRLCLVAALVALLASPFIPAVNAAPTGNPALDAKISGYLKFQRADTSTIWTICRYCYIDVFDDDSNRVGDASDWLGSAITDYNGWFSVIVNNADDTSGVDPFLMVTMDYTTPTLSPARLVDSAGTTYKFQTYTTWQCRAQSAGDCGSSDTTGAWALRWQYSGSSVVGITTDGRNALWVWDSIAKSAYMMKTRADGPMITATALGKVTVKYPDTTTTKAVYDPGGSIRLPAAQKSQTIHAHEYGHYLMYVAFGSYMPPGNCNGAFMGDVSNPGCSWKEGWADYIALEATQTPVFTWETGEWKNLEYNSCSTSSQSVSCTTRPWNNGNLVELRIASTLWDLADNVADGRDYSFIDYRLADIWTVMTRARADNFEAFLANAVTPTNVIWPQDSFNAAAQNNIFAGVNDGSSLMVIRYAYPNMNWNTMTLTMTKPGKYSVTGSGQVSYPTANQVQSITASRAITQNDQLVLCTTNADANVQVQLRYASWTHLYTFPTTTRC
jgi:hypothetical protein